MPNNVLIIWDFIGLIAGLIALVLSLRIVWRVEKRLDTFFKIITLLTVLIVIRQVLRVLTHIEVLVPAAYFNVFDTIPILTLVIALFVMNRLIEEVDEEK